MVNFHFRITRTILQYASKSLTIWSQVSPAREETKMVELLNIENAKPAALLVSELPNGISEKFRKNSAAISFLLSIFLILKKSRSVPSKGPLKYYFSKEVDQKMAVFADLQYYLC